MADPIIVDISHYQPDPDWRKLKAAGVVGVILKATESTGYVDPTFGSRYEKAIAAGLAVSSYHFLRPGNIQAQMNFYLNTVKPRPGERMCLDHEDANVLLADLENAVAYLMTDSRDLQITIYSGSVIKQQLGSKRSDLLAENTSLWLAQYTGGTPSWPTGTWPQWSLWQYTDKASVSGISGPVDGNKFNGSAENAAKWLNPASAAPIPVPPVPRPVDVIVSVQTAPGLTVAVLVNGEQAQ